MLAHGPQGRQGLDADRLQVEPVGGQIILPIIDHLGGFFIIWWLPLVLKAGRRSYDGTFQCACFIQKF